MITLTRIYKEQINDSLFGYKTQRERIAKAGPPFCILCHLNNEAKNNML